MLANKFALSNNDGHWYLLERVLLRFRQPRTDFESR